MYNQIAQLVHERADANVQVMPAPYPAPPWAQFVANVIGTMQILLIGLVLLGDPSMLPEGVRENKMATIMGLFFGASMLSSAFTKTNAFEIYVGKDLVFSKLQAERMPNMQDLVRGFKKVGMKLAIS